MEQLLHDIPMTVVYIDGILVTGRTPVDHDRDLSTVLTRLQDTGIRLKKDKCAFRQRSCTDVDHIIYAEGIHPTEDKARAVLYALGVKYAICLDSSTIYTIILLMSVCQCSQSAGRNSCSIVSVDVSN